ncbi:MAG: copper homeostasis protein CutC [Planctomycetes bacterium]|nr:copper homeostasis protein CutC [Planctomycetota bacterium]
MPRRTLLEVCVDSVEGAIAAQEGGADRIELCAGMLEGGTTPSVGLMKQACRRTHLPVYAMIRPRGGDFFYSEHEFKSMEHDVETARTCGARGVVLGILTADGRIDRVRIGDLVQRARPLVITFHRAFDMSRDPFEALEDLVALGVDRILTSGQAPTALEGLALLAQLVERAAGRIRIMPGGGVRLKNIATILRRSGALEIHVHPSIAAESPMSHRNPKVSMNSSALPAEYSRTKTSVELVRAYVAQLEKFFES